MVASKDAAAGVIPISTPFLILSMMPLLLVVAASRKMDLDLESTIVTSAIRTFIQLSILGYILRPIFMMKNPYLVLGYCTMMIVLAANVACRKSKYVFFGQFYTVLLSIALSVGFTGLFAFAIIIRPKPVWNPQYVIPMVGMLLGNSVNGISITMNSLCIALVEQKREIELLLSFGATSYEAVSRLLREAVRSGTTPILNSMAVIGIISIPGMMTGQILGGSPVMEAARYQMLIMYLIAVSTFGAILMEIWVILQIGFDSSHIVRSERFEKAPASPSFFELAKKSVFVSFLLSRLTLQHSTAIDGRSELEPLRISNDMATSNYRYESTSKTSRLQVQLLKESIDLSEEYQLSRDDGLIMDGLTSIVVKEGDDEKNQDMKNNFDRILFKDLSFKVGSREIFIVGGPSGSGKSQLLRSIAGLSPLNSGTIRLDGEFMHTFDCSSEWRKRVRYVTQYKVDVPGSPRDFVHRIVSFKSWKKDNWPSAETVIESATGFLEQWGLKGSFLDKEWSSLSGGEAQRIIVAISLASKPNVLLLDESTSSLDMKSKISVESSVDAMTRENGLKILWVSHDPDIFRRYE